MAILILLILMITLIINKNKSKKFCAEKYCCTYII